MMTKDLNTFVTLNSRVAARVAAIKAKFAAAGYAPIEVAVTIDHLKPGLAGNAHIDTNEPYCKIAISIDYLIEHTEEVLERTVAHEMSHIYVWVYRKGYKQHHGPEFREMMNVLGLAHANSTRHSMKLTNGPVRRVRAKVRYMYVTPSGRHVGLTACEHRKFLNFKTLPNIPIDLRARGLYGYGGETIRYTDTKKIYR